MFTVAGAEQVTKNEVGEVGRSCIIHPRVMVMTLDFILCHWKVFNQRVMRSKLVMF